jgi:hypothetical protein
MHIARIHLVGCLCALAGCAGSHQVEPAHAAAPRPPKPVSAEVGVSHHLSLEEAEAKRRDAELREQVEAPEMARAHEADDSAVRRGDVKPILPIGGDEPPPIHPRSMKP